MSINDPHLEAEMDLETRYPHHSKPAPPDFTRRQAWVLLGIVVVAVGVCILHFALH